MTDRRFEMFSDDELATLDARLAPSLSGHTGAEVTALWREVVDEKYRRQRAARKAQKEAS